jgi:hypothetical protein
MTLNDMKKRVLSLIEEIDSTNKLLTDDKDIQAKINYVIDTKQHELARIKKISAVETIDVIQNQTINLNEEIDDFYKLNSINDVTYTMFDNIVTFLENGTATINYYKYPKMITDETDDSYKFELSTDVLEIMPLGIAADLLKNDPSAQYGQVYSKAYQEALNMLDINPSKFSVEIVGGI